MQAKPCTATILAIDPGPNTSAYVLAESESASYPALSFRILLSEILRTEQLLQDLPKLSRSRSQCVIEGLSPYGQVIGQDLLDTAIVIGRLIERADAEDVALLLRRDVKLHLCGSARATDAHVRASLIARLGSPGTRKKPGPTYGIRSHCWAALALALTAAERPELLRSV